MLPFQILLTLSLFEGCRAFVNVSPVVSSSPAHISLHALTERQQQFWEDVEDGLDDVAAFYEKKGGNINRVRRFGMR